MSDDFEKVRKTLTEMGGHLQDLQAEQRQTVREVGGMRETVGGMQESIVQLQQSVGQLQQSVGQLQQSVGQLQQSTGQLHTSVGNLQARAVATEAATIALGGTFASLEQLLTGLFADRETIRQLKQENELLSKSMSDLARRVEALERRAS